MNRTFAIIKPDAIKNNNKKIICNHIIKSGFKIIASKIKKLTTEEAQGFYMIHKNKTFYNELIQFMSSGQCMVLVLEKDNAVEYWRNIIGNTNPKQASEGTIRKLYGTDISKNAVHGSDSNENAKKEIAFFFSEYELI